MNIFVSLILNYNYMVVVLINIIFDMSLRAIDIISIIVIISIVLMVIIVVII